MNNPLGHCLGSECKPGEDGLCRCLCSDCDAAYFRRNLKAALQRGATPDVRGRLQFGVMLDDENFFLPSK